MASVCAARSNAICRTPIKAEAKCCACSQIAPRTRASAASLRPARRASASHCGYGSTFAPTKPVPSQVRLSRSMNRRRRSSMIACRSAAEFARAHCSSASKNASSVASLARQALSRSLSVRSSASSLSRASSDAPRSMTPKSLANRLRSFRACVIGAIALSTSSFQRVSCAVHASSKQLLSADASSDVKSRSMRARMSARSMRGAIPRRTIPRAAMYSALRLLSSTLIRLKNESLSPRFCSESGDGNASFSHAPSVARCMSRAPSDSKLDATRLPSVPPASTTRGARMLSSST